MLSLKSQKSLTFQIFLPDLEPRIPNLDFYFLKYRGYFHYAATFECRLNLQLKNLSISSNSGNIFSYKIVRDTTSRTLERVIK